jgi:galactokinase
VCRAPGRVNLIGEHTDYNEGFVLPIAINLGATVTVYSREDRVLKISSEDFSDQIGFELGDPAPAPRRHWSDYPRGVAIALEQAGYQLKGADLEISSDVPIGAGLSSSAAIEVATGFALLRHAGFEIDRFELAKLCQRAENEFVGMRCGIMDQFIACHGRKNHALLLDCRSLESKLVKLPEQVRLVICNTMIKHELATGEYNRRRSECDQGVRLLAQHFGGVKALRDVSLADLESVRDAMPDKIYRRCRHVISENVRVLKAVAALESQDLDRCGQLMDESHESLRDDYEVTCSELDTMVSLARSCAGVYGSRMTGGGFGGCTINLVAAEFTADFAHRIAQQYQTATGITPEVYVCHASDGVNILNKP